jgi:hypothetical protein
MDDEFELDPDDIVDLDVTGDPQLDQFGYQSPRRDMSPPPAPERNWLAQFDADMARIDRKRREAVRQNLAETRHRNAERRGQPVRPAPVAPTPPVRPDLPPHVAQEVAQGMPGRDLGWWRVDVDAYGRAWWTKVDVPGPGPRITVEQTQPVAALQPQWHPVEMTEPSRGTRVW